VHNLACLPPCVLVFWSRDPDGSQHNTGDSLNTITPGINGPTSMAAIKNADNNLAQLRKALDDLGLAATTNIIVSADHGFSTISKESKTSPAAKLPYEDTPKDFLPMGFLAIDLAKALDLPLFDPNDKNAPVADGTHPKAGNGVLGKDPAKPDIVIATNGGSDLVYLPSDKKLAGRAIPGTLPMSALNLKGKAVTPNPSIVVNFRSWSSGCEEPTNCSVQIADTVQRQGQGMHGSFSRGDTLNFMAAIGPDFKAGYVDPLPVSNADVGMTAAQLLGLRTSGNGGLQGRVMSEALPNGIVPKMADGTLTSKPAANGLRTIVKFQRVLLARGGEVTPPLRSSSARLILHQPDVEHVRQLHERQRGGADHGCDHRRQRAVAATLAAHLACDPLQHMGVDIGGLRRGPACDVSIGRQRHGAGRHRQPGCGCRMVGDRLGEEVVEATAIAALGGSVIDLEQRLGLGPAHGLMLDGGRGQDARAPGGVIGVERAGEMDAALGGRAFAGDHTITHDGQRMGGGIAAGRLQDAEGGRGLGTRGRHSHTFSSYFSPAFPCGA
jgi:Type I phosphodiesterase / nucleotide pyrophosphatase